MKKIIGCLLALLFIFQTEAQQNTRYVITFKNKANNPHSITNPSTFLSQRSINRRTTYGIAIDSTDLPVTPRYIDSVKLAGPLVILNSSKWLNAVSIQFTDTNAIAATLGKINAFPFVQSSTTIAARTFELNISSNKFENEEQSAPVLHSKEMEVTADVFNYGQSYNQVHMHNGEFLHNIGLRGQGMVIGVLDAGFSSYLTLKSFDSARANNQILGVYDFVAKDSSVNEDHSHGMQCLSTIAANIPSQFVGTGPKASFYLFRTEDANSEYPIEEFNWVCGAERLDSVGGDVLSSSLGYNTFNAPFTSHTYADMNGNTTTAAIGADMTAKKGILVVNSAGNEGGNSWKYIITPADGDSVMAVGAVDATGKAAGFTSLGPSSDGQVKPDVASKGVTTTVQLTNNTIGTNNGTSFAAPNFAGLTACLWQGFKEYNNMKIIDAIRQSGSRANNPNDSIGYGIPDVKKATLILLKSFATSAASISDCKTSFSWTSKDVSAMKYEIERKNPGSSYVKVGEKFGTGNSFATHSYQFEDPLGGVNAGTISYRIRQVVDTSVAGFSADYIDTVTVILPVDCAVITAVNPVTAASNELILVPNPAHDLVNLKFNNASPVQHLQIRIINAKGQTVSVLKKSKQPGPLTIAIPIQALSSGRYFISIYDGNKFIATKELVKL